LTSIFNSHIHPPRNQMLPTLVKIQLPDAVFPDLCPVCGQPATVRGSIAKRFSRLKPPMERYYDPEFDDPTRSEVRVQVPVCREHWSDPRSLRRLRPAITLVTFCLAIVDLLLVTNTAFLIYDGMPVPPTQYVYLTIVSATLLLGLWALGSGPLERAISIQELTSQADTVILRIKNRWYAEELVRLNPGRAAFVDRW